MTDEQSRQQKITADSVGATHVSPPYYDAQRHHRRSIRLCGYDYTQAGAYFVTVCTQGRACMFGQIVDGQMRLNDAGRMVVSEWNELTARFTHLELDEFVVMPNHMHGILIIVANHPVGAGLVPARDDAGTTIGATTRVAPTDGDSIGATTRVAPTVGDVVGAFKSITTVGYTRGIKHSAWPAFHGRLWQRNYYEHIIRNDESLNRIREYIANNPMQWEWDRENVGAMHASPLPSPRQGEPWRI